MEVHYQLTSDDFYHYQRYWWRRKSKIKPWMLALMVLAIAVLPSIQVIAHKPLQFVLWIVPPMVFMALLYWLMFKPLTKWQAKAVPGLLAPHVFRIDGTSLVEQTTVAETKVSWSQIESIEDGDGVTYLFINNRHALLLPWRAFSSPAETQAFLSRMRNYWHAAKNGLPIPPDDGDNWPPPPRIGA